ncbi:MAG: 2-C-methyl-D-erythritol 4-phosphate cytidylyltransferase [Candidatus Competibacterales bacterium]|nr:2-C-methyl-D-erythritol 4-phosphate cytidylyltransferase [Candidatus Competibacterales bacterium]
MSTAAVRHWLLVPAAGQGLRMGGDRPKQYLELAGRPLLLHALHRLLALETIAGVVVVLAADDPWWPRLRFASPVPLIIAPGGTERWQSVRNGLEALRDRAEASDWVLVHDAARPCVGRAELQRLLLELADDPVGGLLATPVRDTLKRADDEGRVVATESRDALWQAQTPQMFRYGLLCRALDRVLAAGLTVTDEAAAVEALGQAPRLVPGRSDNLKITTPEDLALAEILLHRAETA